jgi:hypothetical protein
VWDRQLILISSHSCSLVLRGCFSVVVVGGASPPPSLPGTTENVSDANDWRDCVSSSLTETTDAEGSVGVSEAAASAVLAPLLLFAIRAAFFCCSSCVRLSTGSSLTMFSVAVGSSACTV